MENNIDSTTAAVMNDESAEPEAGSCRGTFSAKSTFNPEKNADSDEKEAVAATFDASDNDTKEDASKLDNRRRVRASDSRNKVSENFNFYGAAARA